MYILESTKNIDSGLLSKQYIKTLSISFLLICCSYAGFMILQSLLKCVNFSVKWHLQNLKKIWREKFLFTYLESKTSVKETKSIIRDVFHLKWSFKIPLIWSISRRDCMFSSLPIGPAASGRGLCGKVYFLSIEYYSELVNHASKMKSPCMKKTNRLELKPKTPNYRLFSSCRDFLFSVS